MSINTFDHSFYLCFKRRHRGVKDLSVRTTEKLPSLDAGEIAVYVTVSLPRTLFQKPQLRAQITVPVDSVSPATVDAAVAANIAEVVKQQTGLDLTIMVGIP